MLKIDKTKIAKFATHGDADQDGFVADATPEERFLMVWELTKIAYTLQAAREGSDEPEFLTTGLQRHIIELEEL